MTENVPVLYVLGRHNYLLSLKVNFVGETQLTVTQLASIYVVWEFSKVSTLGVESLLPFIAWLFPGV